MNDCTVEFSYTKNANYFKIIDKTKVPLILVKTLKWDTYSKTIVNGCAYACAPHLVQLK